MAACLNRNFPDFPVLLGVRHWDVFMRNMYNTTLLYAIKPRNATAEEFEQGFIDNESNFVNRQEAWVIALAANQIVRRVGGDTAEGGTLYSENLY